MKPLDIVETLPLLKQCVPLANIYILLKGFYFPFHSADTLSVEVGGG